LTDAARFGFKTGERRRFVMPIPLRADFDATQVLALARTSEDARQVRRLLALAAIYDGASRTEAARIGAVTLQVVHDWIVKFNMHGPDGLIDRKAPGQPPRLNSTHREALAAIIENGPIPAVHGVVRWRIVDLCQWVWTSSKSASPSRPSAVNCVRWGIASFPRALDITLRPRAPSRL
jgi:transposase